MIIYQFTTKEDLKKFSLLVQKQKIPFKVHTPIPYEELYEEIGIHTKKIDRAFYTGSFLGVITAFLITYVPNVHLFPINIGGKPLNSWPAFCVIAFELMILFGGLSAVGAFIWSNKFPRFDKDEFLWEEFNKKENGEYFLSCHKEVNHVEGKSPYHIYRTP